MISLFYSGLNTKNKHLVKITLPFLSSLINSNTDFLRESIHLSPKLGGCNRLAVNRLPVASRARPALKYVQVCYYFRENMEKNRAQL